MFDVRVRYTGTSLSIAIATLIGGAVTPSLGILFVEWFDGKSDGVAMLLIFISIVAAISAHSGRKTVRFKD